MQDFLRDFGYGLGSKLCHGYDYDKGLDLTTLRNNFMVTDRFMLFYGDCLETFFLMANGRYSTCFERL